LTKYLNKHYWLRKLFVNKVCSKLLSQKFLNKIVFNSIYKSNYWNKSKEFNSKHQSYSGPGSIPDSIQTNNLIKNLEKFFLDQNIKQILDAPCGDCAWIDRIFKMDIQYTGIDIVDELILHNKNKYRINKNVNFYCEDLTEYNKFNNYDFILLRDFFIHLPLQTINNIVNNLKKSNCKYYAFNNYENIKINREISTGQHRKINLTEKPFNFGQPFLKIQEVKNKNFPDKDVMDNFLYIYKNNI
tara:strand:- start:17 stop:745 length:729 start_codon:yes stop_codon:yes gene_type:complete